MSLKNRRIVVVTVAMVAVVIVAGVSIYAIEKKRTDGPDIILHNGLSVQYGINGSGWGIGFDYPFSVKATSTLVGSWASNGPVKAVVYNQTEIIDKNFSSGNSVPFTNNGTFNMTLKPGNYEIEFFASGNVKISSGYVNITSPVELIQTGS